MLYELVRQLRPQERLGKTKVLMLMGPRDRRRVGRQDHTGQHQGGRGRRQGQLGGVHRLGFWGFLREGWGRAG